MVLLAAAWSAISNPALASILSVAAFTPTSLPRQFWAQAALPKAAYTPTPLPAPTQIATQVPTVEVPEQLLMASIVDDTSASQDQAGDTAPEETVPQTAYAGNKYILVDISEQHLYAYENGELLYSFIASTGMNNATAVGNFAVQSKIPNAYGSTWDIWMPNWLGIYWSGGLENGIHALPILPNGGILWDGFLGRPISYGCVVLGTYDSQLLYDWSEYGTPVDIQW
jgi:lipoprotein-anchoring transpeptidase ErfK/SrfK